jgi:hypothetical protein
MLNPKSISNYKKNQINNNINKFNNELNNTSSFLYNEQLKKKNILDAYNTGFKDSSDILQPQLLEEFKAGELSGLKIANLTKMNPKSMEYTKAALYYDPSDSTKFKEENLKRLSHNKYNSRKELYENLSDHKKGLKAVQTVHDMDIVYKDFPKLKDFDKEINNLTATVRNGSGNKKYNYLGNGYYLGYDSKNVFQ